MIAVKDIPMLVGLGATVLSGGFYVHDIKRDVAELSNNYRSHVAQQQETTLMERKWKLEDRLRTNPNDTGIKQDIQEVDRQMELNKMQQHQLKGVK